MRRAAAVFMMLMIAVLMQGCIRVSTTVSVNSDGSGTVTERVLMNLSYFRTMLGPEKGEKQTGATGIPSRKSLEKNAAAMGEGVRFRNVRKCSEGPFEGYQAVYAFMDVSRLTISGRPDERKESDSLQTASVGDGGRNGRVGFRFSRDSLATLVIVMPESRSLLEPEKNAAHPSAPPAPDQQKLALAIMREAFKGTRMRLVVTVRGEIVSSDADCMDGAEAVLADIDFDRLLSEKSHEEALLNLTGYGSASSSPGEFLNRVPGVRGETKQMVAIVFR
ncbi:MAG: hypothetical protein FJY09_10765 [Chlorobi bacterium]|nr:hypothetical protein [Chlorobiota bacterium]